ncbi:MAG: DNA polymerase/3'-5' exonuclease PolX [Proteobacteria bacterium]|nr:DNA polymerase/3'-5' exonuclease PolX [Pseudomonadota bacterium]
MAGQRDEILAMLRELAELTVLDEQNPQSFRVRAYENAFSGLQRRGDEIAAMSRAQLQKIDGVGKSTADKIREYFDTGRVAKLEALREKFPPALVQLSKIPGLGPKSLARIRSELGVENLDDLRRAIAGQQLRELPGFGAKSEEKLAAAIERLGLTGKDRRTPIRDALPLARRVVAALEELPEVAMARYCGSLRRFRETIGDIDIVVATAEPESVMQAFASMPMVSDVIARGDTKTSILTASGLQVDLRAVKPEQFGAAILYFTGSKAHNIKLRQRAIERGWTLNEYGLLDSETGRVIASETEEEIYAALDLQWIAEPMRENTGEVEHSADGTLPELVVLSDLNGDLHVHTSYSGDGRSSLDDIVARAASRGYAYLAITDHGEDLAINGVSRERLLEQRERLRSLQDDYPDMRLLHGCELNIAPDGGLDYDQDFRMQFDWCVAAVHSHFELPRVQQTERIIKAMQNPAVNVIGHLSGRYIGQRPGIDLDIDAVLEAAAETGTAIEINSALKRLDAASDVLRRARDSDVTFVISTDAHHTDELTRMQWGTLQATRGWVAKKRVANTWTVNEFLSWANDRRAG